MFRSVAVWRPHTRYLLDHHVELRVCVTVMALMVSVCRGECVVEIMVFGRGHAVWQDINSSQ